MGLAARAEQSSRQSGLDRYQRAHSCLATSTRGARGFHERAKSSVEAAEPVAAPEGRDAIALDGLCCKRVGPNVRNPVADLYAHPTLARGDDNQETVVDSRAPGPRTGRHAGRC